MAAELKYKPEYCAELIEHMKQDGASYATFAAKIHVSPRSMQRWEKKFPEWEEAKQVGQAYARLYYERTGHEGMMGKIEGFNATVWIFTMKNRFGWKDRQEKVRYIIDGEEITEEQMRSELLKYYQDLKK